MWGAEVHRVRTLFLRCVCLSYAVAFHSLYTQLPGLYGPGGLLPVGRAAGRPLLPLLAEAPSLLWLLPAALPALTAMELLCLAGSCLGLAATLVPSLATTPALLLLYTAYLSLFSVGGTFLSFQWDTLLLEAGVLALLAAPLLPRGQTRPLPGDHVSLALVRWLLFRMMLASGAVKLTSGCPAWWGLTAMPTHYFSQCLPTPLAWFAALQPDWLHKLSVATTYVIEIALPFLFFAPTASLRKFTALAQVLLMTLIMLTGNYNFFNFLYLALCLSLADDTWLSPAPPRPAPHLASRCLCCLLHITVYGSLGWAVAQAFGLTLNTTNLTIESSITFSPADFEWFLSYAVPAGAALGGLGLAWAGVLSLRAAAARPARVRCVLTTLLHLALAIALFLLSLPSYSGQLDRSTYQALPAGLRTADRALQPLHLTNSYGLFRRMTGVGGRPEVVLEGAPGPAGPWTEYQFRYKPGNTSAAPLFMLPHQPRLDWQMWFAALGSYEANPWLVSLAYRLLEGRPEVLALLSPDSPWRARPPALVRARRYTFTFTSDLRGAEWWERREEGEYLPVLSRDHQPLKDYLTGQGILGAEEEPAAPWPLGPGLAWLRRLSDSTPPHLQIWTYAWLALPLFKPFVLA